MNLRLIGALLIATFLTGPARAADQAAIAQGQQVFGRNCSFCHGQDARGTDQAPDLALSSVITTDENGKQLAEFLKTGRADKGMPAFNALSPSDLTNLASYLHGRVEASRTNALQPDLTILVGNAEAGEKYFNGAGKCNTCHSPTQDLKGLGSKYDPRTLQDCFVNPRVACGHKSESDSNESPRRSIRVKVATPAGEVVSGTLLALSDFEVTLRDSSGTRRSFARDNDRPRVEISDPLQAHLDQLMKYTDKDMHDLTAYLVTLK